MMWSSGRHHIVNNRNDNDHALPAAPQFDLALMNERPKVRGQIIARNGEDWVKCVSMFTNAAVVPRRASFFEE